jgi:hypothetical protein
MSLVRQPALQQRFRSRTTLVLAAVVLVATACGSPPRSGVNVKSLGTDLVYGVPPTVAPAPPANTAAKPENPLGTEIFTGESGPTPTLAPGSGAGPCPEASLTDAPPPTTSSVESRPKRGVYRWVYDGTREIAGGHQIKIFPFADRAIQNVKAAGDGFEFTAVEKDIGSNDTVYTTYEVRDPKGQTDAAGVYLTQIQRAGPQRQTTFSPAPAVLILPLPAQIDGSTFRSVGVDPISQEALTHTGTIVERKRVDACGDWVDGWLVDAAQTFVRADGGADERNYDYAVATQFGGMLVFERVQSPCAPDENNKCSEEPALAFEAHLGQESPRS